MSKPAIIEDKIIALQSNDLGPKSRDSPIAKPKQPPDPTEIPSPNNYPRNQSSAKAFGIPLANNAVANCLRSLERLGVVVGFDEM